VTGDERAQPVRVLVAEDDPRVRAALRAFLSASPGVEVVGAAGDAAAALELARDQGPTVALVDVLLPEAADGLALLRALTRELGIPAIAISIHGGLRSAALAAGAHQFLDKDRPPDVLLAALRSAPRHMS
jgi:DNA-binding NarL/FixJ family response regulator